MEVIKLYLFYRRMTRWNIVKKKILKFMYC